MKKKDRKTLIRTIAFILVLLMVLSTLAGALSMFGWASAENIPSKIVVEAEALTTEQIAQGAVCSFRFYLPYLPEPLQPNTLYPVSQYTIKDKDYYGNTIWSSDAALTILTDASGCMVSVNDITYQGTNNDYSITFSDLAGENGAIFSHPIDIVVSIPRDYYADPVPDDDNEEEISYTITSDDTATLFNNDIPTSVSTISGDIRTETTATYASNIVFEQVAITRDGKTVASIDSSSEPFDVTIIYTDTGLADVGTRQLRNASMETFLVPGGAFLPDNSTRGSIRLLTSRSSNYPRFQVTFSNVTYRGTGNELAFQTYYLFNNMDTPIQGQGTAMLDHIITGPDGAGNVGVAVPKMIIDSYSYGETQIVAGSEFNLDFTVRNTSTELPVENITITLAPAAAAGAATGPGLLVASSSNTMYVPTLAADASESYSIAFKARPDAEVTSHLIEVKFAYEYIDTQKQSRETAEMTETIAIPVAQMDRFSVDPVTEISSAEVGQEGYLPVSFINRGMLETRNISLSLHIDDPAITSTSEHYGNLEAGGSDLVELVFVGSAPGEYSGEVIVQYENDANTPLSVAIPCTVVIEQPYVPPMTETLPAGMAAEPESHPNWPLIIFCSMSGVLILGLPLFFHIKQRRKKRREENWDEDF